MMRISVVTAAVLAAAGLVWATQAGPVNKSCPVKAGMPAKADITVQYKGSTIGFCCGACKGKFANDPEGFAARIPELKSGKSAGKKAATGPCQVKKTVKGYFCLTCDRQLGQNDVRGGECKKCETKPEQIDVCIIRIPIFTSKCQHKKSSEEPFVCCGKPWGVPTDFRDDLAACSYRCDVCGVKANVENQVKHKDDCKPNFGSGVVKVCTKSGKAPHASE